MEQFKPSPEKIAEGKAIAAKTEKSVLYINDKGEFFTVENYALGSVAHEKKRVAKIDYSQVSATTEETVEEQEAREEAEAIAAQEKVDAKAKADAAKAQAKKELADKKKAADDAAKAKQETADKKKAAAEPKGE